MLVILLPLKFCRCLIEQTSSLVFQCVACDTIHLIQYCNLRRPGLLCLIFESTHPLWTFRWLVPLQRELHHELLAHTIDLLFPSLLVGSSNRVCLAPATEYIVPLIYSENCERLLPL